jgi:toxin FitB
MIVLDTNVLSTLMQRRPEERVVRWLDEQSPDTLWITAITVFEVHFGVSLLPPGRRRRELEDAFARTIAEDLQGRVLPFDHEAARLAGEEAARRQSIGRRVDFRDVEIAGIVASNKAVLATRNVRHFRDLGIDVVDPWSARS